MAETDQASLDATLAEWVQAVCTQLEIDPGVVDIAAVLDLAKDAAHGVARPAAPLTTFLAGYVAGRTGPGLEADPAAVTRKVLAEVAALVPGPPDLEHPENSGRHASHS